MSASRLHEAGYSALVSIIPPGVDLSPNSRIREEDRGKVPGRRGSKGWYGYNFVAAAPPSRKVAEKWDAVWGANVGLLAAHYPALDLDVEDPKLAAFALRAAERVLGTAPVRLSRDPRRLLVYRTEDPFPRRGLLITKGGQSHLVEFLGEGRQYLVHGTHPSGSEYRWDGAPLWEWRPEDLTLITSDLADEYLTRLAQALGDKGYETEFVGKTAKSTEPPPPQEDLRAPSIEELRALVDRIPNPASLGRDEYIQMGYAVRAAGAEDEGAAFEVWQSWADRWEGGGSQDVDADLRNWERLHGPYKVGWSWLQERAEDLTEDYVTAQEEFEADPDAAPPPVADPDGEEGEGKTPLFILHSQAVERPELLEPPEPLIPRLAWRGRITLLAGSDKSGKSTLMTHGAAALTQGREFLGEEVAEGRVVWVGPDEALGDTVRRSEGVEVEGDRIMYLSRPHPKVLPATAKLLDMWPADLLVIDSLAEYARVTEAKAPEEGDSAGWGRVIRPLAAFAREYNMAVVVLHHVRRSDGQYRGSGEIAAAVDVLLEVRTPKATEDQTTRRIRGRGRWNVEPFAFALGDDGYTLVDRVRELPLEQRVHHLIQHRPGLTKTKIALETQGRKSQVIDVIDALIREGMVEDRGGEGGSSIHPIPTPPEEFGDVGLDDLADPGATDE